MNVTLKRKLFYDMREVLSLTWNHLSTIFIDTVDLIAFEYFALTRSTYIDSTHS